MYKIIDEYKRKTPARILATQRSFAALCLCLWDNEDKTLLHKVQRVAREYQRSKKYATHVEFMNKESDYFIKTQNNKETRWISKDGYYPEYFEKVS